MKTEGKRKDKGYLFLLMILSVIFLEACQEMEPKNGDFMALSNIERLLEMDKFTFMDYRWRLLGFGEVGSKYIRIAEPKDTDFQFWFQFHEDGTFEGRSSGNMLAGNYLFFENNQIELLDFFVLTYAGETEEGKYFIERKNIASSGKLDPKGLMIQYEEEDKAKYMLFRPLK
jgi:hypothetical protein